MGERGAGLLERVFYLDQWLEDNDGVRFYVGGRRKPARDQ